MKKFSEIAITVIFLTFIVLPIIAITKSASSETVKATANTNTSNYSASKDYATIKPMVTIDPEFFDFLQSTPDYFLLPTPELAIKATYAPPTPSPTIKPTPENIPWKTFENMVFVSKYKKIHKNPKCSGMKEYYIMEFDEAVEEGYVLCHTCY